MLRAMGRVPTIDESEALQRLKSLPGWALEEASIRRKFTFGGFADALAFVVRLGFEAEADKIQDLFFAGKRAEAIAAVPDQFADEVSLVGPIERIRDRLQAWKKTPVTTLLVAAGDPAVMRTMAELVL